jgi:hypothetical protein
MAHPLSLGKTDLLDGSTFPIWGNLYTSWLKFYLLVKKNYFMVLPLPLGKNLSLSWLNLLLLAKKFYFMT